MSKHFFAHSWYSLGTDNTFPPSAPGSEREVIQVSNSLGFTISEHQFNFWVHSLLVTMIDKSLRVFKLREGVEVALLSDELMF